MQKGQSAIEFITTYGIALLIIAIAVGLLYSVSSFGTTILPTQCSSYGGFSCVDGAYYNYSTGSQFNVILTNTEPGLVNVSTFNAVMDNVQSTNGFCLPQISTSGNTVNCVANFSIATVPNRIYSGTFTIGANYCDNAPGGFNNTCIASDAYLFSGSFKVQSSPMPH
jgi:hypothetical protein